MTDVSIVPGAGGRRKHRKDYEGPRSVGALGQGPEGWTKCPCLSLPSAGLPGGTPAETEKAGSPQPVADRELVQRRVEGYRKLSAVML